MLARPRVCPTIATLGLSLGFLTVPQREWSLTLSQHLLVVLLHELLFTSLSTLALHHEWLVAFDSIKLTSRKRPF
jgi:hypothetical protein